MRSTLIGGRSQSIRILAPSLKACTFLCFRPKLWLADTKVGQPPVRGRGSSGKRGVFLCSDQLSLLLGGDSKKLQWVVLCLFDCIRSKGGRANLAYLYLFFFPCRRFWVSSGKAQQLLSFFVYFQQQLSRSRRDWRQTWCVCFVYLRVCICLVLLVPGWRSIRSNSAVANGRGEVGGGYICFLFRSCWPIVHASSGRRGFVSYQPERFPMALGVVGGGVIADSKNKQWYRGSFPTHAHTVLLTCIFVVRFFRINCMLHVFYGSSIVRLESLARNSTYVTYIGFNDYY